jgi:GTP-dependent phosphoenolpyruvate carboxykinase
VPNDELSPTLGLKWGCCEGEIDPRMGKEMWREQMRKRIYEKFTRSIVGRTMYIIPFSMGVISREIPQLGVEKRDSKRNDD